VPILKQMILQKYFKNGKETIQNNSFVKFITAMYQFCKNVTE